MNQMPASIADRSWHDVPAAQALEALEAREEGLTTEEAASRLDRYGPNRLPEAPRPNMLFRFLRQFHNILIYVLIGAAALTALLGHWTDTFVILAVVVANAAIGFFQEGKAERAMDAIRHMLALKASVLRDGRRMTVDGDSLVPGDIVLIEAGDKVPADLRLFVASDLQVQEAILTGESLPVEKQVEPVEAAAVVGDRLSMVYSGTLVTKGAGKGVVVGTALDTEFGRISGMLQTVEKLTTPLLRQMDIFARWLTALILLVAALLLAFGYFVGHFEFSEMFMAVVGLSVAAIPEGLPAVLTITLAVGVQAMAGRNAIVRRLPAIETLGSVSVICTDKTGTLTRNEMMVGSVVTATHDYAIDGAGYEPAGRILLDGRTVEGGDLAPLAEIGRAAALCNDASLHEKNGHWTVNGDPMEGALLALSGKIDSEFYRTRADWTRTDSIPFDARHRFMATLNHRDGDAGMVFLKGAPEQVISMCRHQELAAGDTPALDERYWLEKAEAIAAQGQRVIALARKSAAAQRSLEMSDLDDGLILIGLVGLIDPPRPEAADAVRECYDAGIEVKMITGDHRGTAAAIGRQIGLKHPDRVLTGAEIDLIDDQGLATAALDNNIFARASPQHKLRLMMALQSRGMTVAMTGDGVNDAPALKRADAGVAMGLKGSEAAKDAAELVLTDDNFASIVAAVREGRTVYDNVTKVISWTLPTSAGEAMTIVVALLFGMTLPITPIQILWINLITATTLGMALAFEPTEENTMQRRPRPRNQPLLSGSLAWHIVLVSILFIFGVFGIYSYAVDKGYPIELTRTIALNTLVVMEIFHLFFIRNIYGTSLTWKAVRGTRIIWATVIIVTIAQFSMTYLPPLQAVFETRPVPFLDGLLIVGVGVALFAFIEIEKQMRLRLAGIRGG